MALGDSSEQQELVTMTREQLQGERDAWYENGLRNAHIRATESFKRAVEDVESALTHEVDILALTLIGYRA